MKKYIYGIDVGGTFIKLGLFRKNDDKLIVKSQIPTPKKDHMKTIFDAIVDEIEVLNKKESIHMDDIDGIGLAIPCPTKAGYVSTCSNLEFCDFDIEKSFKKRLPTHISVKVANDATLAALGENKSLEKPFDNAVLITLGTGVGGGIIIDSKIYEGKSGIGGEIGHIKVFDTDEICGCGSQGCLEQVCGTKGILSFAKKQKAEIGSILEEKFSVKDVFDAAKNNDKAALNTVNRVAKYLAIAAVNLAVIIEPEAFIIGGGVSKAGDFLLKRIIKAFKENARFDTSTIPFILASTGNDAGMIGAYFHVK